MINTLLGDFELLDIITILSYVNARQQAKSSRRPSSLSLVLALMQQQDQAEIKQILKEIRDGRKGTGNENCDIK